MELLKPNIISGEILTLIEEAKEKIVLVSPYVKISKWYRLVTKIKEAQARGVEIIFYVREGESNSIREVEQLGVIPRQVKNLHCKLYYNEKYGVVPSLNLLLSSEINSLEIAYKTKTRKEYKELCAFHETYLLSDEDKAEILKQKQEEEEIKLAERNTNKQHDLDWKLCICEELGKALSRRVNLYRDSDGQYILQTRNRYNVFIHTEDNKRYVMCGILSGKEFEKAKEMESKISSEIGLNIVLREGGNGRYDTIYGELESDLSTNNFDMLTEVEIEDVINATLSFVYEIEKLKEIC